MFAVFLLATANCIFDNRPPSMIPQDMDFELPCVELCWEAKTSEECFELLKRSPRPIKFLKAFGRLWETSDRSPDFSQLSALSMFILIHGEYFHFKLLCSDI